MNLLESLNVALSGLGANKVRSGLTMLGIIIGVGAVISLMALGSGAQESILGSIRSMGTNLIFVAPGVMTSGGVSSGQGTVATLTYEDAIAIGGLPSVAAVAPENSAMAQLVYGNNNTRTRVTGTTPDYLSVRAFDLAEGEFFTQQHVDGASLVAVLGPETVKMLFGEDYADYPIGKQIRLTVGGGANATGYNFRVIGVMAAKGAQAMGSQDDAVYLPITTVQQRLQQARTATGAHNINMINVQAVSEQDMLYATQEIGELLRTRHKVNQDDFTIMSQEDILQTAGEISGLLTMLLGAIAGISLIVGGIGIMNIMLVSVTERTREIGIRKAVGARKSDILMQFLIESAILSLTGGLIGILVGMGIAAIISSITIGDAQLTAIVTPDAVLLATGVSAAIGLFFGIYPASRAAGLHPIEALRYE